MATLDDEELRASQHEVQRLLGRSVLWLQKCERLLKAIEAERSISGPIQNLGKVRASRVAKTKRGTLGALVNKLLGSYVVDSEPAPLEAATNSSTNGSWFSLEMSVEYSDEEYARIEAGLKEMVQLRNDLVHHFFDQHDLRSHEGCNGAKDALDTAQSRIEQNYELIRTWAEDIVNMRQSMSDAMQTEEVRNLIIHGAVPVRLEGFESALREAFDALAVEGWASVAKASLWISERYPELQPVNHGCRGWRQLLHESPNFELRRRAVDGVRAPYYRGRINSGAQVRLNLLRSASGE